MNSHQREQGREEQREGATDAHHGREGEGARAEEVSPEGRPPEGPPPAEPILSSVWPVRAPLAICAWEQAGTEGTLSSLWPKGKIVLS